ncbi:DMT family transporter [Marinobacter sp. CA1]|uniref:DMT family transporter n=1 Tax=Marinobacter sp. CA1 TaxID=2817656 RepID=UPI001D08BCD9|nr:DMT family transporter [Marinobacter sp. CA1]UDL05379.1 DMT family transporter [Marinobacter sp. CA1]
MLANAAVPIPRPDPVAYLLLLMVGGMIALTLPLAKLAMTAGLSPLAYAFWQALGGGVLLGLWNGRSATRPPGTWRYWLVSGLTAIAIPNALAFIVVGHVGSGLTATLYALPSLATYALSLLLRLERLSALRTVGLLLGVAGCIRIMSPDTDGVGSDDLPWLLLGLLVPLSLAFGNVYRSVAWPQGASARQLAPGMLLGGALVLGVGLVVTGRVSALWLPSLEVGAILAGQAVLAALTYRAFFELQRRSSPVFLSQIGFVIAPAGLVLGMLFFDEQFGAAVWLGVGIVLLGVLLANWKK